MNGKWPETVSDKGVKHPKSTRKLAADAHACDAFMKIGASSDFP
jgi:hypothetical protein